MFSVCNLRVTAVGNRMITALATCMSHLFACISIADAVVTERRRNQIDTVIDITADWFVSADGTNIPVDKYWSRVAKQVDSLGVLMIHTLVP